jgi:phage terminase large subunit
LTIDLDINKTINKIYQPLLDIRSRFLILYGGGGSGKSYFACQKIIYRILTEKNHKFLIVRKVQRTLRHSCFYQIISILHNWNIYKLAQVNKTDLEITFPDFNSSIIFAGCDDIEK